MYETNLSQLINVILKATNQITHTHTVCAFHQKFSAESRKPKTTAKQKYPTKWMREYKPNKFRPLNLIFEWFRSVPIKHETSTIKCVHEYNNNNNNNNRYGRSFTKTKHTYAHTSERNTRKSTRQLYYGVTELPNFFFFGSFCFPLYVSAIKSNWFNRKCTVLSWLRCFLYWFLLNIVVLCRTPQQKSKQTDPVVRVCLFWFLITRSSALHDIHNDPFRIAMSSAICFWFLLRSV